MTGTTQTTLTKNTLVPVGVLVSVAVLAYGLGTSLTTLRAAISVNAAAIDDNETDIGKLGGKIDEVLKEIARLQGIRGVPAGGEEVSP
jgi:hypothetical protein